MNLEELKSAMINFPKDTFILTTEGHDVHLVVKPDLIYEQVGNPPRRVEYSSQDEYHDSFYAWQDKAKEFSLAKLLDLSQKVKAESKILINSWNKPVLIFKNLFTSAS
jgi:hypothetical protein